MRPSRCIAFAAIAVLAACSEQQQNVVTDVQFDIGEEPLPHISSLYQSCTASGAPNGVLGFAVAGTPDSDPAKPGTQFTIIGPEYSLNVNHGMITSYVARNGVDEVNAVIGVVNDAVAAHWTYSEASLSKPGFIAPLTTRGLGKFTGVIATDLNNDAYRDAVFFVPRASLEAAGFTPADLNNLVLEGRHSQKTPLSRGTIAGAGTGTAPCAPPAPPPPVFERFVAF